MKLLLRRAPVPAFTNFFLTVSLLAPLLLFYEIRAHVVNVPSSWDEWDAWVPLVIAMRNGTLRFADLWALHNEHRMLTSNLIMLGLAKVNGWNMLRETMTSLAIVVSTQAMLLSLFVRSVSARLLGAAFLLATACLYNLMAFENWLTGFQTAWFLVNFAATAVTVLLWLWPRSWVCYALAILTAFGASFAMSSGLMVWPLGLSVLLLRATPASRRDLGLWVASAVVAFVLYFHGYQTPGYHPSLLKELSDPLGLTAYLLAYFGSPFTTWMTTARVPYAAAAGAIGLLTYAFLLVLYAKDRSRDPLSADRQTPWVALAGFAFMVGLLTMIGRSGFGAEQSLTSRYVSNSSFLWIGIIGLTAVRLGNIQRARTRLIAWLFATAAFLLFGYGYGEGVNVALLFNFPGATKGLLPGAHALAHLEAASPKDLEILYPSADRVRKDAAQLRALHEGPYYDR